MDMGTRHAHRDHGRRRRRVADVDEFCQAELAAEAAASGEDPAAAGPAFEALVAAAPADLKATVEDVIAHAEEGPGSPGLRRAPTAR